MNLDSAQVIPFATNGDRNHQACWSPDGRRVAFVRKDQLGSQIWVMPSDGGEAQRLTTLVGGASAPAWSADGTKLFALAQVSEDKQLEFIDTKATFENQKAELSKRAEAWKKNSKRYRRLYYKRDGEGLSNHERAQLVEIDLATKAVRQLTAEPDDIHSYSIAADGKTLYFLRGRDDDLAQQYTDLYRLNLETLDISLVNDSLLFQQIECSPVDGSIAAIATDEAAYETYGFAAHANLYLLDAEGRIERHLSKDFPDDLSDHTLTDLGPSVPSAQLIWSNDGHAIYVLSEREAKVDVVRFTLDSSSHGEVVFTGPFSAYQFAVVGHHVVAACSTFTDPSRLYTAKIPEQGFVRRDRRPTEPMETSPIQSDARVLYAPNQDLLANLELSRPESFWFQSEDDWWVQGWVMKPIGYSEGKTYPVILEIHGGPHTHYGTHMFHEMQWFAAQGYAVVYVNPRGSTSYGQEFVNAVRQHYGEKDAQDILNGLQAALDRYAFLDGTRVAVTGGSYGGFMTNWLVGHTKRFFAAVSQRSISNWISFFGCSDIGPHFVNMEVSRDGIQDLERLWKSSPLAYADDVETPILLIHSEQDLRCPIEQAEQFYTWLKYKGKEAEFVRVPDASHGLSRSGKPSLRIQRLQAIFGYIHDHLPNV